MSIDRNISLTPMEKLDFSNRKSVRKQVDSHTLNSNRVFTSYLGDLL